MLAEGPARIDNEYLSQFTEFIQFRERNHVPGTPVSPNAAEIPVTLVQTQTPDELLRNTVKQIETALRKELLDRVIVAPSSVLRKPHCQIAACYGLRRITRRFRADRRTVR